MRRSLHPALSLALLAPLTVGCASTLNAAFERSVSTENIYDHKILTMTGERRLAIVVPRNSLHFVCAESLPDAARASGARSALDIQTGGTGRPTIGVDDQVQTALLQTFTRTETADVVRQLGWQVCNAYANRAIGERQYGDLLTKIIDGANIAMETRAKSGTAVAAAGGTVQVNLGQPQPRRGSTGGTGGSTGTQGSGASTGTGGTFGTGASNSTGSGSGTGGTSGAAPTTGTGTGGTGTGATGTGGRQR